ncbi:MAG TPA: hypothetical protein VGK51_01430 [Actinomycetota bacterium]|jgi:hypothetical protein
MNAKRLLGSLAVAGTLAAASIGTAAPAFAAPHIAFTLTPSDGTEVPGKTLDAHGIRVAVSAKSDCFGLCSMASLSFTVKDPDGNTVASGSAPSNNSNFISASTTWDTQPTAKKNGNYTLAATAAQGGVLGLGLTTSPAPETQQATLKVNNPPVAPTGIQTALDAAGVPVVSWSPNPEPDIKGYQVYRSDGALQSGLIPGTSFRDANAPTGQALSYKVAALRFSPVDQSGLIGSATSAQTAAITAPVPAGAAGPQNAATADPAKGGAASGPMKQPVTLSPAKPAPIAAPTLPTRVVQLPQPNVIQFAPLLPYSGKVPEVPVNSNVPPPVAAQADQGQSTAVVMPGGANNKVTPVDAIKYVAAAAFLIVAAVHVTRFARKIRNAPV